MSDLFVNSLPLLIPLSLSPILLAGVILALSRRQAPLRGAVAWLVGTWVLLAITAAVVFLLEGQVTDTGDATIWFSAIVDIVLGALLLAYATVTFFRKKKTVDEDLERDIETVEADTVPFGRTFLLAIGVMTLNAPFWLMAAAIFKETAVASISGFEQFLFVAFVLVCAAIPAEVPILLYRANPERAMRRLTRLDNWLRRHDRVIIIVVGGIIGIYLLAKGIADIP